MVRNSLRTLLLAVVAAFGVSAAPAMGAMISGTIGPPACSADDCLGAHWTLEVSDAPVDMAHDLHVTFVASFPGTGLMDDDESISPTHITNVEFALPGDITGAFGTNALALSFTTGTGPLNGNGCGEHNGNFMCATGMEAIVLGSSLTWEWDVDVFDVGAVFDPENTDSFHLGAKVWNTDHTKGWLVSVNPIPEPSSALVFTAGALVVGVAIRKKLR
jgi:hypothetical protein